MSAVFSHPATMEQVRTDPKVANQVREWERATIRWLQSIFGSQLKTVIRHTDEAHAHLHAYIVPETLKAKELHPGHSAKAPIKNAGVTDADRTSAKAKQEAEPDEAKRKKLSVDTMLNRRGDQAYKEAMREWQDSYYESVGIPCGLARLGPKRRRLTREAWKAEKVQAQSLLKATKKAEVFKENLISHISGVQTKIKQEISTIKSKNREFSKKYFTIKSREKDIVECEKLLKNNEEKLKSENLKTETLRKQLEQEIAKAKKKLGTFSAKLKIKLKKSAPLGLLCVRSLMLSENQKLKPKRCRMLNQKLMRQSAEKVRQRKNGWKKLQLIKRLLHVTET